MIKRQQHEVTVKEQINPNYLRVTEVLQPYNNFENIPPHILHNACERGTKVHRYCELYAMDEYFPEPAEELQGYVESFTQWHDEVIDKVLYLELRLYNDLYRITGAVDMIAVLKGDRAPTVIDYKTPATESKSWALQTAAYQFLADGYEGIKPTRRIALQLRKSGNPPKVIEYTDFEKHWNIYKGMLAAKRFFDD